MSAKLAKFLTAATKNIEILFYRYLHTLKIMLASRCCRPVFFSQSTLFSSEKSRGTLPAENVKICNYVAYINNILPLRPITLTFWRPLLLAFDVSSLNSVRTSPATVRLKPGICCKRECPFMRY